MPKTSRTEQLLRDLMAHYHPELKPRYGYRPGWLKNPETGRNLEIDAFYPDLQAGCELQGIQHGRPIDGLQKDFAAFEKQQRHDMLKVERCKEYGVVLYSLTIFDLTEREFLPWLKQFEINHLLMPNRYVEHPVELFAAAEKLSRARIKLSKQSSAAPVQTEGFWQRFWRWLNT